MNHCIGKCIVEQLPENSIIVFEDLRHIRKTAKTQSKKQNRVLHGWAFSEFERFLTYKAAAKNISVVYVNTAYTSQECSRCGYRSSENRDKAVFHCGRCGLELHADLNAARTIQNRYMALVDGETLAQLSMDAIRVHGGVAVSVPIIAS